MTLAEDIKRWKVKPKKESWWWLHADCARLSWPMVWTPGWPAWSPSNLGRSSNSVVVAVVGAVASKNLASVPWNWGKSMANLVRPSNLASHYLPLYPISRQFISSAQSLIFLSSSFSSYSVFANLILFIRFKNQNLLWIMTTMDFYQNHWNKFVDVPFAHFRPAHQYCSRCSCSCSSTMNGWFDVRHVFWETTLKLDTGTGSTRLESHPPPVILVIPTRHITIP